MIRQREEGDTKGGIVIPKDKFKEFVMFQKSGWKENQGDRGFIQGMYIRTIFGYTTKLEESAK